MNSLRPDGLVFDLDGTLWDAAAASTKGWNSALEELGASIRVTVDDIRSVSGRPFPECVEALLPGLSPPSETLLATLLVHERAVLERTGGALYDGVAEGLRSLAAAYPLYLVSNCPDWYLEAFLRISGLRAHFAGCDCYGSSGMSKADMLANLAATRRLQAAVYLGDTQGDREAAEAAGMTFVHAGYGFGELEGSLHGSRADLEHRPGVPAVGSFREFVASVLHDTGGE